MVHAGFTRCQKIAEDALHTIGPKEKIQVAEVIALTISSVLLILPPCKASIQKRQEVPSAALPLPAVLGCIFQVPRSNASCNTPEHLSALQKQLRWPLTCFHRGFADVAV